MFSSFSWKDNIDRHWVIVSVSIQSRCITNKILYISALDPDPLDPKDFSFLDPDPQKYADLRIPIQGVKYQQKTATKKIILEAQIFTIEKERL